MIDDWARIKTRREVKQKQKVVGDYDYQLAFSWSSKLPPMTWKRESDWTGDDNITTPLAPHEWRFLYKHVVKVDQEATQPDHEL